VLFRNHMANGVVASLGFWNHVADLIAAGLRTCFRNHLANRVLASLRVLFRNHVADSVLALLHTLFWNHMANGIAAGLGFRHHMADLV